ncbi:TonB-dependent receptor [Niabella sp.]|uniref:SusC/RagA family TonB-linked outer membrane protein n=1 Tax=Niabella sp. TaxID=1962976 RepID=UPI002616A798|nr:TonB-dependent receptor [Niabella sp.]
MKLTVLFLLFFTLNIHANGFGQQRISLKVKKTALAEVLRTIEEQTAYRFLYNNDLPALKSKVTLNAKEATIEEILPVLLFYTDMTFRQMENNLIVIREDPSAKKALTITGKVTDSSGAPLSGVSVQVKGTTIGTITNADGAFTLSVPDANSTLVFSMVGYDAQEYPLNGAAQVTISLKASQQIMDQVVVIGYGTATKRDLTAPITSVNTEELAKRTTSNVMGALQGAAPGVQIVTSGAPGASPTVRIRGVGSSMNENPLYVVDGMLLTNIDFLNPNDIADMSVLKDASAAAIYGVRAANGVVIITTKKGKLNMKTRVTYNGYVGLQVPTNVLKMADARQYAAMQYSVGNPGDSALVNQALTKYGGTAANPTTNTDWYDQILRKQAIMHSSSIDLAGGSEKVTYSLGLSYLNQDGILNAKNSYNRYNIRTQMEVKAFPWLKVGFTAYYNNSTNYTPNNAAFTNAYYASPLYPVYDSSNKAANPTKFASPTQIGYNNGVYVNPVAAAHYYYNRIKGFQILPTLYAEANIIGNKLIFRTQLSQRYESDQTINYYPQYYVDNFQKRDLSQLTSVQDRYTDLVLDNLLTYKDGKNGHHWTVLLGQSARDERWRQTWVMANGVPNVEEYWYATQGTRYQTGYNEDGTRNTGLSYFARASYDYQNKYLLTATFRADGSSKYQTKWGYFPSVGLGWVLTQENFLKNQNAFSLLKLRGSWGKLGNDGVRPNPGYPVASVGNDFSGIFGSYGSGNGTFIPGYNVNPFFTQTRWEVVEEWDAGLDFTALNNKLDGSVDWYRRVTHDMAFDRPVANFNSVSEYGNWASVLNTGWELALNWKDKVGDFNYNIGGNISTLKNRVLEITGIAGGIRTGRQEFPTRIQVGQPINYFYGYEMTGVYQSQAEINADPVASAYNKQNPASPIKPGFLKFKDQNGDGLIDPVNDRVNLGNYLPKITYGLNIGLGYKKFDLSIAAQGVGGNKILNFNRAQRSLYPVMNGDAAYVTSLWTTSNPTNSFPSAEASRGSWSNAANSFFVENGAYFRIQNIQLGYNFEVGKSENPVRMRVYATADRPLIFTRYSGFTPEITAPKPSALRNTSTVAPGLPASGDNLANTGYDNNVYPVAAVYSLGVRVNF